MILMFMTKTSSDGVSLIYCANSTNSKTQFSSNLVSDYSSGPALRQTFKQHKSPLAVMSDFLFCRTEAAAVKHHT